MYKTPVTEYQEKIQPFRKACIDLRNITASVRKWADRLKNINDVMVIANINDERAAAIGNPHKTILNAAEFPSRDELCKTFESFYRVKDVLRRAWEVLPVSDRVGLQSPSECEKEAKLDMI